LRKIMEAEGVAPGETVMIGDGVQDFHTARRAGTRFLGFLGGMAPRQAMLAEGPEAVIEDMAGLPEAIAALEAKAAP
jgi:phosphoglycolate phosphatase-like HAD superfamily hydrolase